MIRIIESLYGNYLASYGSLINMYQIFHFKKQLPLEKCKSQGNCAYNQRGIDWMDIIYIIIPCLTYTWPPTWPETTHNTKREGWQVCTLFTSKQQLDLIFDPVSDIFWWHLKFMFQHPTFENGPNIQASCQDQSVEEGNGLCQRFKNCSNRKISFDIASFVFFTTILSIFCQAGWAKENIIKMCSRLKK